MIVTIPEGPTKVIYVDREWMQNSAPGYIVKWDGNVLRVSSFEGELRGVQSVERLCAGGPNCWIETDKELTVSLDSPSRANGHDVLLKITGAHPSKRERERRGSPSSKPRAEIFKQKDPEAELIGTDMKDVLRNLARKDK